jgi:hypothetical protein
MRNCSDCYFSTVCIPKSYDRLNNDEATLLSLAVHLMPPTSCSIQLLSSIEQRMRCRKTIKYSAQCLPALHAVEEHNSRSDTRLTKEQMHAMITGYIDGQAVINQYLREVDDVQRGSGL